MNDFERRRIQNREAQRRFRRAYNQILCDIRSFPLTSSPERHSQRKAANEAVQTSIASEVTTDQRSRRESPAGPDGPAAGRLIDPSIAAAASANSLFSTAFDHDTSLGTGMYSPTPLDGIDFTNSTHRSCIHDQGVAFPTSPSSLLQASPADTSTDSNTDQIFGAFIASTHNSDSSLTTLCESVYSHSGGPGDEKRGSGVDCVSLAAAIAGNGAASTSSGLGEKPDRGGGGGWQNPLHIAAAKGHDRIARILLQHNIDCNEKDSDGLTPLIHATVGGYEDVVRSLLSHGATIDTVDCQHRRSALHWAVVHRRESVLKILLDRCATQQTAIDSYDEAGRTPLHTAVDTGYDAGVQLLLQLGANAQYRTRKRKPSC